MFGKNTYLHLPQVSSSLHSRAATSVVDLNGNEIQLHDMLSGHYLTTANAPVLESTALFNNNNNFNHDVVNGLNRDPSPTFPTKQAVKKDRHSKIYTSQGPRDRRVRLSIGIARKFFDLQEMLGFDKPSKTLDWLLTKSKTAIKELVQSKSTKSNSSSPCDDCEEVVSVDSENVTDHSKGKSLKANNKCKEAMDSHQAAAKESRAKARARARERTKEKMCIKQLNEAIVLRNHQFEVSGTREAFVHPVFGFHQQNYGNASHENWDQSNFASQSNQLCAILNQHKFIN